MEINEIFSLAKEVGVAAVAFFLMYKQNESYRIENSKTIEKLTDAISSIQTTLTSMNERIGSIERNFEGDDKQ